MQDDVETFLSLKPRVKEWLPELPGLHKLSKSEAQVDLDQIIANLHQTPTVAQLQALGIASNEREDGKSRKSLKKELKGKEKETNNLSTSQSTNDAATPAPPSNPTPSETSVNDRRRRLQEKILGSREIIQSDHTKAAALRLELDQLRNEILSYEDAILQAKREIDSAKRERREIDLEFNAIRAEYEMQLHKLTLSRSDAEATEVELKQRLTKSARENHDLSERLHQLRQLEDEFKLKDARIEVLTIQNQNGHRKLAVYETMSSACADPNATNSTILNALTTVLSKITMEAQQGVIYNSAQEFAQAIDFGSIIEDPNTTAAFRKAIMQFLDLLVARERAMKLIEEESADKSVMIADHIRSSRSLIAQLEKSTNVHGELHLQMRQMEVVCAEERSKTDAALTTIQLLQKQKSDQQTLLFGYEERMKHFQQLLTAADVRADSANTFLSELLKQWNVLKYGTRTLQSTVNTMQSEMRKLVKERNDAYLELNDRVSKYATSLMSNNAPATPPSFHSSGTQSSVDRYWIEKDKKIESHIQTLNAENALLRQELAQAEEKLQEKNNQTNNLIERSVYESSIQSVNQKVEQYKRGIVDVQSALDQAIKVKQDADQTIAELEIEIRSLKAVREADEALNQEAMKHANSGQGQGSRDQQTHSSTHQSGTSKSKREDKSSDDNEEHKNKKRKVESTSQSNIQPNQSNNQSINQSNNQSMNQMMGPSNNQTMNGSPNPHSVPTVGFISSSIYQSINQSNHQPMQPSNNMQMGNQSISQTNMQSNIPSNMQSNNQPGSLHVQPVQPLQSPVTEQQYHPSHQPLSGSIVMNQQNLSPFNQSNSQSNNSSPASLLSPLSMPSGLPISKSDSRLVGSSDQQRITQGIQQQSINQSNNQTINQTNNSPDRSAWSNPPNNATQRTMTDGEEEMDMTYNNHS